MSRWFTSMVNWLDLITSKLPVEQGNRETTIPVMIKHEVLHQESFTSLLSQSISWFQFVRSEELICLLFGKKLREKHDFQHEISRQPTQTTNYPLDLERKMQPPRKKNTKRLYCCQCFCIFGGSKVNVQLFLQQTFQSWNDQLCGYV